MGEPARVASLKDTLEKYAVDDDILRAIPCILALATIARYEGEWVDCFRMLEEAQQRNKACNSRYLACRINVMEACCALESGHAERAQAPLARSIELGMRGGYLRVYTVGGATIRELMLDVATKQRGSQALRDHAKKVLSILAPNILSEMSDTVGKDETKGYWSLTEREREVLKLLNQGLSRTEIADEYILSQNTVKSHLKSIYTKLGAHSRAEVLKITRDAEASAKGLE